MTQCSISFLLPNEMRIRFHNRKIFTLLSFSLSLTLSSYFISFSSVFNKVLVFYLLSAKINTLLQTYFIYSTLKIKKNKNSGVKHLMFISKEFCLSMVEEWAKGFVHFLKKNPRNSLRNTD